MDLLRFTTAGSVDDGKSTLIGRLLYDTKSILQDQYEAIERSSARRGKNGVDLALLTDGLRAEREQGITIDVAYRYFSTPKRAFVISDTPGHEQYTRNMVTGASGAELAIILIDARNGVMTQSRRHGFIASLLQIPHFVVAVNKMDLVDFSEARFEEIRREFAQFVGRLNVDSVTFIPISALDGDNVVEPSERTPWYDGATLLHHLETVKVGAARNTVDFRMPVQLVARPNQDFRGFSGEIESGSVSVGEDVLVLPARTASKVARIVTFDGDLERAQAGMPVTLTLEDEIDASRGDMIVRARNVPRLVHRLDADVCWMSETPMKLGTSYIIRHTTRTAQAAVDTIIYRTNVNTLHREEAATLKLNEIGRVELDVSVPLAIDPYRINRRTGCFVLVDPATNATVAAGMIRGEGQDVPAVDEPYEESSRPHVSPNVTWEGFALPRVDREAKQGHAAAVIWLTGLSGAGKTTIARALERRLFEQGLRTVHLDGDALRHGLNGDLGFSPQDRSENIRRVGEVARLFFETGHIVLCTFISPYRADRNRIRALLPAGRFVEVHVDCPVEVCKDRDPKGLYAKNAAGHLPGLTGVDAPYEAPQNPELRIDTSVSSAGEAVDLLLRYSISSYTRNPKS